MLDPRIKLRHLNSLLETVRRGGVARAGASLGMTQPAVSKALAELEAILTVPLFDRSRRSLTLTPDGEMFARFAGAGLAALQQGLEAIENTRTGVGAVAFGALPTVAASVVPRALLRFAASPLARPTRVESGPSPYLLELLRTAAIDFVIGRMPNPSVMQGLSFEHLYSEQLAFVVRPAHPLADAPSVGVQMLEPYQLVIPPREAIIRPAIDALLLAAGARPAVPPIETVSNSLGRSYLLISDAVWIISRGVVEHDLGAGQLVQLAVDVSATRGPIGITTRSGADLSLPAKMLLDCVRRSLAP